MLQGIRPSKQICYWAFLEIAGIEHSNYGNESKLSTDGSLY